MIQAFGTRKVSWYRSRVSSLHRNGTRSLRRLLMAVGVCLIVTTPARAQRLDIRDSIQYSGIAFLEEPARFPTTNAMLRLAAARGTPVDSALVGALRRSGLSLRLGLAQGKSATALAFAFGDEYRIVERYSGDLRKVTTGISAQLLAIRFTENEQVIQSAFPFLFEYVDVMSKDPGVGYDGQVAAAILPAFVDPGASGVFQELVEMMQSLPAINAKCTAKVMVVDVDTGTWSAGLTRFAGDSARMRRSLGNTITGQFTSAARMPLLPVSDSRARSSMLARFANGEATNIRIPDPDFEILIENFRTRRMTLGRSASRRIDATGVQFAMRIATLGRTVASGEFRLITQDTLPASTESSDPWPVVLGVTKAQAARIGMNTLTRNSRWFDTNDLSRTAFPALPDWLTKCSAS